jgi:hypothetical protein
MFDKGIRDRATISGFEIITELFVRTIVTVIRHLQSAKIELRSLLGLSLFASTSAG